MSLSSYTPSNGPLVGAPVATEPYYRVGGIDTLDYLHAKLSDAGYEAFLVGMVHKKLHKAFNGPAQGRYDAYQKAAGYMAHLLDLRGRRGGNPIPDFAGLGLHTPAPTTASTGPAATDVQSAAPPAPPLPGTKPDAAQYTPAGQGYGGRTPA